MEYSDARLIAADGCRSGKTDLIKVSQCKAFSSLLEKLQEEKKDDRERKRCYSRILYDCKHEEVETKLVNTEIVRMANWGDVCEIIDGYFRVKEEEDDAG